MGIRVEKSRASQAAMLICLVLLTMIRGMIYASIVPPWQAPDEPAQFERARAALTTGDWRSTSDDGPGWYDELIRSLFTFHFWDFLNAPRQTYAVDAPPGLFISFYQEIYQGLYGSRIPYATMAWPLFLAREQDITFQLYLVRLNTILLNVGVILLAYLTVQLIFPHDLFLKLGVPLLILFNPQHTHMLSTVNNGNLAELLATAAIYCLVRGIIKGFSWLNMAALLVFTLAAMWTKATAYFLPFAMAALGMFFGWQFRRKWRWLVPLAGFFAIVVFYFLPRRLILLISDAWHSLRAGGFYLDPLVPTDLFRSFWAMPGWAILRLHPFWYGLLALACLLSMAGLVMWVIARRSLLTSDTYRPQIQALTILAVAAIVAIGVLLGWNAITNSIVYRQGRSIFPVIVPLSIFLMLGWRHLISPARRQFGLLAISTLLFLFDVLVLANYIIPFFYSRY